MQRLTDPCVRPGAFASAECVRLIRHFEDAPDTGPGRLAGGTASDIRVCHALWLDDVPDTAWIFRRLAKIIAEANREVFQFDLREFGETVQILRYDTADIGHPAGQYAAHSDIGESGESANRKLSLSIQLSVAETYDGGNLEIDVDGAAWAAPRDPGTAILFPSFVRHRVSEMSSGSRYALVAWMHGPAFR